MYCQRRRRYERVEIHKIVTINFTFVRTRRRFLLVASDVRRTNSFTEITPIESRPISLQQQKQNVRVKSYKASHIPSISSFGKSRILCEIKKKARQDRWGLTIISAAPFVEGRGFACFGKWPYIYQMLEIRRGWIAVDCNVGATSPNFCRRAQVFFTYLLD